MRNALIVILAALLGLLSSCVQASREPQPKAVPDFSNQAASAKTAASGQMALTMPATYVSPVNPAAERKVIRNAELTLELATPEEGKRMIETVAGSNGGFVVSSEVNSRDEGEVRGAVTLVLRIPAARFSAALEEIRKLGYKIRREKITGQDVTEEYVDLEARLKAKRAVEAQFLEIMKQANKVVDALEVQKALGEVRSDIEQMEGRRRFLDNQVALSTFTITLQAPAPLMSTTGSGFFQGVKEAVGEGFDAATQVVLWLIRFALVLIPIVVLVVLPAALLWRRLRRKNRLQTKTP
jgi:hypothetical protein